MIGNSYFKNRDRNWLLSKFPIEEELDCSEESEALL